MQKTDERRQIQFPGCLMHKNRFGFAINPPPLFFKRRSGGSWIIKYVSGGALSCFRIERERGVMRKRERGGGERGRGGGKHEEKTAPLFNDRVTIERRPFGNLCHQPRALGKSILLRGTAQDGW